MLIKFLGLAPMHGLVFQTSIQPTQQNPQQRTCKRAALTAEEQASASKERQAAAKAYSDALDGLWSKMREGAENVAIKHRKSFRKVSSDIHMIPTISLGKHSKVSPWNTFLWSRRQADKENGVIQSKRHIPPIGLSSYPIFRLYRQRCIARTHQGS